MNQNKSNYPFEVIIQASKNLDEFFTRIKFLPELETYSYFRNYIVYSKQNIDSLFNHVIKQSNHITKFSGNTDIKAFVVAGKNLEEKGFLVVIPHVKHEFIYRVFTIADYDLAYIVNNKILSKLYPLGIRTFFKQDEIYHALKNLEKEIFYKYSIVIVESTYKGKDIDPNNISYIKTERSWKKQTVDEAFEEAKERQEWFSSIKFSINKKQSNIIGGKKIAECRINKDGEIYYSGLSDYIVEYLQEPLIKYVNQRLLRFQNRGIRDRGYEPSLPLEIQYDFNRFDDIEEIRRFGFTMKKYPKSSIATYHSNPYYHSSIADSLDGSSFDVWILSSRRIIIKPQLKSTPQALERIISYISSEFGEGNISEYSGQK